MRTTVILKPNGCHDKVKFIKAWRGMTGASLKEAKDIGDAVWKGEIVTDVFDIKDDGDDNDLKDARRAGVDIVMESKDTEYFTRKLLVLVNEALEVGDKQTISILSDAVSKLNA